MVAVNEDSVSCDKTFLCYVGIESWESRTFQVAYHCKVVFSAGADKRILVWDVGKAHKLCELKGHTDTICQLMFSRDGSILASGVCLSTDPKVSSPFSVFMHVVYTGSYFPYRGPG